MATAQRSPVNLVAQLHLSDQEHPVWSHAFAAATRSAQIEEDLFAARTVGGVLFTIVTAGALLGALSVVLATALW